MSQSETMIFILFVTLNFIPHSSNHINDQKVELFSPVAFHFQKRNQSQNFTGVQKTENLNFAPNERSFLFSQNDKAVKEYQDGCNFER